MAYIGHEFYYDGTRATFFAYLCTALVNMGWELHDDIDADTKVFKSNGESGNELYGYLYLDAGTSTYIQFGVYQYWNNATHAGVRPKWPGNTEASSRIDTFYSNVPALIAGDKDIIVVLASSKNQGAVHGFVCGHVPRTGVVTSAHGTAGTAGTLTVASTAGLGKGLHLQIVSSEGYADNIAIMDVINSSTVIVDKLAINYGTGSKIGAPASVFGISMGPSYYSYFYPTAAWGDIGTAGTSTVYYPYYSYAPITAILFNEQATVLSKIAVSNAQATLWPGTVLGFLGDGFRQGISTNDWDVMVGNNDGGFSTAGTGSFGTASSSWSVFSPQPHDGGFESWDDAYTPTYWSIGGGTAGSIARESTTKKVGTYSAKIVRSGTNKELGQTITTYDGETIAWWVGKTVSIGAWVYCTTASGCRLTIWDGAAEIAEAIHPGGGWQFLIGTITVSEDANNINIYCTVILDCTAYFDSVSIVEGSAYWDGTNGLSPYINIIKDTTQSWGTNAQVGRFCVITGGSGTAAGSIKKITGNDATSLTLDSNWKITPLSGVTYILTDVVRRYSVYNQGNILITSTAPPS